ncbi:MAG: hypothetical protein JXA06_13945 [Bacteroidetes bacterium]|nr:hypothetical protein [Bacteroidota bacterium]
MKRSACILVLFYLFLQSADAQLPKAYKIGAGRVSSSILTNSVSDITVQNDTIWCGMDKGLSFTADGGKTWINYSGNDTFDNTKGISAIAVKDDEICVASCYTQKIDDEDIATGYGLHYSSDHGVTWTFIPQPVDSGFIDTLSYGSRNKIRALAITVEEQNITYDIAITNQAIWTASWAGMLRKSTDKGRSWHRVILPPDNLDYIDTSMSLNYAFNLTPTSGKLDSLGNDNHKLFSVYANGDNTIWVGTAGGINKSTDGGTSWRKFSHQNQNLPISGNFVVALKEQVLPSRRIMWAATINANDPDEVKGVSFSSDGGETWKTTLLGKWAYNFAFKDSLVYIGTDDGLYRSSDFGESWIRSGSIYDPDPEVLHRFTSDEIYCVGVRGDTIWCGCSEGIAYTIDSQYQSFGSRWKIFRRYESVGNENRTYAYPNPFAPDDEPVRIHYSTGAGQGNSKDVTIRIFDYAMHPVRTLIQKASRLSGNEYDEIWDGRNDNRSLVANGVYFYRVEIGGNSPLWGKILVLK